MNLHPQKFTWGDTVRVRLGVAERFRPGSLAEVCGVTEPDGHDIEFRYTIEFSDGSSAYVTETDLETTINEDERRLRAHENH